MTCRSPSWPLSTPEGFVWSERAVLVSPSRRCSGVTHEAFELGHQTASGVYHIMPTVGDHNFSQFSVLPPSDLHPTVEESMIGEHLKMLSYADYALAVGLRSANASGAKAADSADCMLESVQVGLRAIEHTAGIALKVCANLELARHDKPLASLSLDSNTKAQLRSLPFGQNELFGGKLDEASNKPRCEASISMS